MVPTVLDVLFLMGLFIVLYAMLCVMLFADLGAGHYSAEGKVIFNNYGNALWNLYVLLSTANFPDVMMRSYAANPFNAIIFISFLMVVLYLIMALVLATIYNNYRTLM